MLQIEGPIMGVCAGNVHKPRMRRSRKLRGPYETFGAPGRSRLGVDGVQLGWTESTENDGGRRPKSTCDGRFRKPLLES